jgi:hypothetical protein
MGAASFLIVLRHVPLDRIDDAQERQPRRPETVLPVHELAKRRAPSDLRPSRFAERPSFLTEYPGRVSWTELRQAAERPG